MHIVNEPGSDYCADCTETGGMIPQAPKQVWCMSNKKCPTPERQCAYVREGGRRPMV